MINIFLTITNINKILITYSLYIQKNLIINFLIYCKEVLNFDVFYNWVYSINMRNLVKKI